MALIELEYYEKDGLLYHKLEINGADKLNQLGKFGKARLAYINEKHFEYYRELLFTGKLAEHCEDFDNSGYEQSEKLQQKYLEKHLLPDDDFMETVRIRTQARDWADEVILYEFIRK